jgi:hypothetical protein
MSEAQSLSSILVADCGTVTSKAALFGQVAGQYRLVACGEAPTTTEHPWNDISEGIRHAVEQVSAVIGQSFFTKAGDLISPEMGPRQGVDAFALTASASDPLHVMLGGLVRDLSIASAERAAAGTYSLIKAILAKDSSGTPSENEEKAVRLIRDTAPNAICIAGGTDGGATGPVMELVRSVTLACSMMDAETRPHLLYAGNTELRRRVVKAVKGQTELRVADNVRPTMTQENLLSAQLELDALYVREKMGRVPGINDVGSWGKTPLLPTCRAFSRLLHYLWHLGDPSRGVMGIDVGAATTTLIAVFDGRPMLTIQGGLGSAFGGKRLLERRSAEAITRWLPESVSADQALETVINNELRPSSIPQDARELRLEHALVREVIRATLDLARPGWEPGAAQLYPDLLPLVDTILVSGGVLAHAPQPGQAALIVLDALQPVGVTTLILDVHSVASALGSLAGIKPLAAVEALDNGALVNLATVVTPVGQARRGEKILNVNVLYDNGSNLDVEVRYGDLEMLPLPAGQEVVLELKPRRRFDVGLGGPGKGGKQRVSGGLAGLIIDARGRPLRLARKPEVRHNQIQRWLWDVGG